jgi:hypothetical protein
MTDKFGALKRSEHPWLIFGGNSNPMCPHCGEEISAHDHELWQLFEEGEHDIDCPDCELTFTVSTNVSYSFSTDRQEEHDDEPAV